MKPVGENTQLGQCLYFGFTIRNTNKLQNKIHRHPSDVYG